MKYIGWILFFLTAGLGGFFFINSVNRYKKALQEKDRELKMWIDKVKELKSDTVKSEDNKGREMLLFAEIPSDGFFTDYVNNQLTVSAMDTLSKIATALDTMEGNILIGVHTDDLPIGKSLQKRFPTNWELSSFRAAVIARFLIKQGIEPDRLIPAGFAYSRPLNREKTPEARRENRRIDIYILR